MTIASAHAAARYSFHGQPMPGGIADALSRAQSDSPDPHIASHHD